MIFSMKLLLNVIGLVFTLGICWLLSYDRKKIRWTAAGKALAAELIIALFIIKVPVGRKCIQIMSSGLTAVINCGNKGLTFVFGDLFDSSKLSVFFVQSLGNIIFVSALVGALYYVGAIGVVVKWVGKAVGKITGTTEVESFVAVANMFMGQTDSPILVAKYLKELTSSELFVILVSGMGSMSASILGGYCALGIPMEHLLTASALVPIGSILVSKIVCPQSETVRPIAEVELDNKGNNTNMIDALSDMILGLVGLELTTIFSYVFAPIGWLMGLDSGYIATEAALLGEKLILNEFIAFGDLAGRLASMDARTAIVCSISLSGFANLSSMGVCIGSIGVLCPEKRGEISKLVFRAMLTGMIVSINSALLVSLSYLI